MWIQARWILLLLLWATPAVSQGRADYLNVESPQVHPIEIARLAEHDYLLVANTADSSVEIWDTDETKPAQGRFLRRVRVGLEPVSVRWHPELERFYATGFLGDSVTVVALAAPTGPDSLTVQVERTSYVGDEPTDIAFFDFDDAGELRRTLFVTHMTEDGYGWVDAFTLEPVVPGEFLLDALSESLFDFDDDGDLEILSIKEPRTLAVRCGRLFLLAMKGGNSSPLYYDFDLFSADLASAETRHLGGLGTTNFNMAFSTENDLYVVGGEALNVSLRDEPTVAAAPTGFVRHMIYKVQGVCGPSPTVEARDVNLAPQPVAKAQALAQLTDVVVFERPGETLRIFFTAFGSDRVGILEPLGEPHDWPLRRLDIRPGGEPVVDTAGPRALALKTSNPRQDGDPGDRLYVLNSLANSVTVIDPGREAVVEEIALASQATPAYIREGRRFLYSARFSGNGLNSCASCHTDGRTDGLAWDLGTPAEPPLPIPPEIRNFPNLSEEFLADKDHMVTQSLQGLLNFEVDPENQDWVTNAPYHWRGDRPALEDFNQAFVSLLGAAEPLEEEEMASFEEFINSIHYPPNPRQPQERRFSGTFGGMDGEDSTGAQAGMVMFHTLPSVFIEPNSEGISCVHCHSLPEGSNNRITVEMGLSNPHVLGMDLSSQPTESAALRGFIQKEALLSRSGFDSPDDAPISGLEGMLHTGVLFGPDTVDLTNQIGNVNAFVRGSFGRFFCPLEEPDCERIQNLSQFVHELDWGVGPMVGFAYTVDSGNAGDAVTAISRARMEKQAKEANSGLVVQAWTEGAARGFWYDLSGPTPAYWEEPGGSVFSFEELLAFLGEDDRLILLAVPLGSERRIASPAGPPQPLPGPEPTDLALLPMVPSTAYRNIPGISLGWSAEEVVQGGASSHIIRLLQHGLITSALPEGEEEGFGLGSSPRHDPPRRLRIAGRRIRHGARLELFTHNDPRRPEAPLLGRPPEDPAQVQTHKLSLPLYPTGQVRNGVRVWETAVELENSIYYRLMLGGEQAPGVPEALADHDFEYPEPSTLAFDAAGWNWHYVRVVNADGQVGDGGWQRLRLFRPWIFADGFESGDLSAWSSFGSFEETQRRPRRERPKRVGRMGSIEH